MGTWMWQGKPGEGVGPQINPVTGIPMTPDNPTGQPPPPKGYSPDNSTDPYSGEIAQGQKEATGAFGDQSSLVEQLKKQMTGAPDAVNLAAAQLHAALQQNAAAASSAMASVKGINPGVARYNVLNQTAAQDQASAGQAAQLRMQEQLAAQAQLAQVEGQQAQEGLSLFGSAGGLQSGLSQQVIGAQLSEEQMRQQQQEFQQQQSNQMLASFMNLLGAGAGAAVGKLGTGSSPLTGTPPTNPGQGGTSGSGNYGTNGPTPSPNMTPAPIASGFTDQSIVAPGDFDLVPNTGGIAAAHGALVPGRASVRGDSSRNDTVPALLSPGEIVIPRSLAESPEDVKQFVKAIMKRKRGGARASA